MSGSVQIISLSLDDLEDIIRKTARLTAAEFRSDFINNKAPAIMTKVELSSYIHKSIPTINRLMKKGLPFEKLDNEHPRFYKSAIDRWLQGERI